jgi:hypothetical protein
VKRNVRITQKDGYIYTADKDVKGGIDQSNGWSILVVKEPGTAGIK